MRNLILGLIILFSLNSCSKSVENETGISEILYQEIIKYQKENPIDKNDENFLGEKHFIYQVTFLPPQYANPEDDNYSVFITMSVFGVGSKINNNCYGVFEDKNLQRTIIYDEANIIDQLVKKKKKTNLEKFIVKNSPIIDIIYPVKTFNFVNEKLNFVGEISGNSKK